MLKRNVSLCCNSTFLWACCSIYPNENAVLMVGSGSGMNNFRKKVVIKFKAGNCPHILKISGSVPTNMTVLKNTHTWKNTPVLMLKCS